MLWLTRHGVVTGKDVEDIGKSDSCWPYELPHCTHWANPDKDHPRWSQASERVLGGGLFAARVPTLLFNGYADQVASLYTGLDLMANY